MGSTEPLHKVPGGPNSRLGTPGFRIRGWAASSSLLPPRTHLWADTQATQLFSKLGRWGAVKKREEETFPSQ